jgi:hypothetical protein
MPYPSYDELPDTVTMPGGIDVPVQWYQDPVVTAEGLQYFLPALDMRYMNASNLEYIMNSVYGDDVQTLYSSNVGGIPFSFDNILLLLTQNTLDQYLASEGFSQEEIAQNPNMSAFTESWAKSRAAGVIDDQAMMGRLQGLRQGEQPRITPERIRYFYEVTPEDPIREDDIVIAQNKEEAQKIGATQFIPWNEWVGAGKQKAEWQHRLWLEEQRESGISIPENIEQAGRQYAWRGGGAEQRENITDFQDPRLQGGAYPLKHRGESEKIIKARAKKEQARWEDLVRKSQLGQPEKKVIL